MSDKPLETTSEREHRIRERAYQLWEDAGRPRGRAEEYWERAEFLIGIGDAAAAEQQPNPLTKPTSGAGAPVDEAQIQGNYGESPDHLNDQGNRQPAPKAKSSARKSKAKRGGGGVP